MRSTPPAMRSSSSQPTGSVLDLVLASSVALRESFAPLGATNIAVFGSVARREERDDSDIDLLVDLDANVGLFALLRMRRIAEQLLGRDVDIVPRRDLKADLEERVLSESIPL